jgi:hypothetical protein
LPLEDLLKVLYAPQEAFKKIIENPKYLIPLLMLLLFVLAQLGASYVVSTKQYFEQTLPSGQNGDIWTENATFWTANAGVIISNNYSNFINATNVNLINGPHYGNSSIQFAIPNSTQLIANINNLGQSVNCSADGFKNLSLRIEIAAPETKPTNVSMYLYSLGSSNFYYDLTGAFSNSTTNVWNNITIPVGSGNWVSSGQSANWQNITGLGIAFTWSSSSNIILRIDGLFFRGIYQNVNTIAIGGSITDYASNALNFVTQFVIQWLALTGVIYVTIKWLKGAVTDEFLKKKLERAWKPVMVAVGFALVIAVIQAFVTLATYTALPNLNYPLELLSGVPGEADVASKAILDATNTVLQADFYIKVAAYLWVSGLCALIFRSIMTTATKAKAIIVLAAAFIVQFLLFLFGLIS